MIEPLWSRKRKISESVRNETAGCGPIAVTAALAPIGVIVYVLGPPNLIQVTLPSIASLLWVVATVFAVVATTRDRYMRDFRAAQTLFARERYDEAIELMHRVMRRRLVKRRARAELVSYLYCTGRLDEAAHLLETLRTCGNDVSLLNIEARVAQEKENHKRAVKCFRMLLERTGSIDAALRLSVSQLRLGYIGDCLLTLNEAIDQAPDEPDLYYQTAQVYASIRAFSVAAEYFSRFLELANAAVPTEMILRAKRYLETQAARDAVSLN
jgi:tetratricopeptide (TPR) repeat protein